MYVCIYIYIYTHIHTYVRDPLRQPWYTQVFYKTHNNYNNEDIQYINKQIQHTWQQHYNTDCGNHSNNTTDTTTTTLPLLPLLLLIIIMMMIMIMIKITINKTNTQVFYKNAAKASFVQVRGSRDAVDATINSQFCQFYNLYYIIVRSQYTIVAMTELRL